ncbi:hypothetical protein PILCRDRAFT_828451 [Piloderma croceum F 1598]|uniref:Uncharacterized protein n=1 Tax=Piloderma croceum (strain F 1598) TaxID=765440 RepID=A0A0C3ENL6_PILCF|nr:hypothetical protein PILCRDRAFT_828451 [Piloderma croceum F 1598]
MRTIIAEAKRTCVRQEAIEDIENTFWRALKIQNRAQNIAYQHEAQLVHPLCMVFTVYGTCLCSIPQV